HRHRLAGGTIRRRRRPGPLAVPAPARHRPRRAAALHRPQRPRRLHPGQHQLRSPPATRVATARPRPTPPGAVRPRPRLLRRLVALRPGVRRMNLQAAIASFLRLYMEGERNASPHTLRNYAADLRQLTAFLGPATELASITPAQLRAFLAQGHAAGVSPATQARHLSALRSLFRYAVREEMLAQDP